MFVLDSRTANLSFENDSSARGRCDEAFDSLRFDLFGPKSKGGSLASRVETGLGCQLGQFKLPSLSLDKGTSFLCVALKAPDDEQVEGSKNGAQKGRTKDSLDKPEQTQPSERNDANDRARYFDSEHNYKFDGKLVLIGGSAEKSFDEVIQRVKQKDDAKVVTVAMASEQEDADEYLAKKFERAGVAADKITVLTDADKPEDSQFEYSRELPEDFDLIFFGGGDQSRLRDRFSQAEQLKKALQLGKTVCGTSAGCAVMSREMITGGGVDDLTHAEGFALAPWFTADTHVDQRGREWRDISALYEIGLPVLGIDGDTNLTVYWDGDKLVGEVGGSSAVRVFRKPGEDLHYISDRKIEPETLTGTGGAGLDKEALVWTLKAGDKLILSSGKSVGAEKP